MADPAAPPTTSNPMTPIPDSRIAEIEAENGRHIEVEKHEGRQMLVPGAANAIRDLLAHIKTLEAKLEAAKRDSERLDWLDRHCSFVADYEFKIGPYKVGQLRQMADDGLAQSAAKASEGGKKT